MVSAMTLVAVDEPGAPDCGEFVVEDIGTGMFASGFGHLGDGRRFSFHVHRSFHAHRAELVVEVYRPRRIGPVPLPEDVIATARRPLADVDAGNDRSLAEAVREMIAALGPLGRTAR
jgi:hypothetical protein